MREHIFNALVILTLIAVAVWVARSMPRYKWDEVISILPPQTRAPSNVQRSNDRDADPDGACDDGELVLSYALGIGLARPQAQGEINFA